MKQAKNIDKMREGRPPRGHRIVADIIEERITNISAAGFAPAKISDVTVHAFTFNQKPAEDIHITITLTRDKWIEARDAASNFINAFFASEFFAEDFDMLGRDVLASYEGHQLYRRVQTQPDGLGRRHVEYTEAEIRLRFTAVAKPVSVGDESNG